MNGKFKMYIAKRQGFFTIKKEEGFLKVYEIMNVPEKFRSQYSSYFHNTNKKILTEN